MDTNIIPACAQGQHGSRETALRERFKRQVRLEAELTDAKQEACAHEMRVDPSTISHWSREGGCDMPAWRIIGWVKTYGPALMEWLSLQCGGIYQHGQMPARIEANPTVLIGILAHQSGDSIQQLIQQLEDGKWSAEERTLALPGLRKLHSVIETLIQDAEGGTE